MSWQRLVTALGLALLLPLGWIAGAGGPAAEPPKYRWSGQALGLCWEGSPRQIGESEVDTFCATGANAISQTPFGWMGSATAPVLQFRTSGGWWGESEQGITALAGMARERGIATLLKPHLWLHDSWPGAVEMQNADDWATWFANYGEFLLHWAQIAARERLEGLCIGTELDLTVAHESEWRALIAQVRSIYPGLLTYAANWTHFEAVPFWDALDAIGVNAYFPLSDSSCPTAAELEQAWGPIVKRLRALSERQQRPVVLTEVGYHSCCNAFAEPWEWQLPGQPAHAEDQAAGYAAVLSTFLDQPWCGGLFFWKWQAGGGGRGQAKARDQDTAFCPQGKLALECLSAEYSLRNKSRTGSTSSSADGR